MASLTVPLPARAQAAARRSPQAWQAAVDEAVRILRSGRSFWPVRSGRSKRAWRRTGTGYGAKIFNPLVYASNANKANQDAAQRTLTSNADAIRQAALRAAATGETTARQSNLADILDAFRQRTVLEDFADIYGQYFALTASGRRAPRIPAKLRRIRQQIEARATR